MVAYMGTTQYREGSVYHLFDELFRVGLSGHGVWVAEGSSG